MAVSFTRGHVFLSLSPSLQPTPTPFPRLGLKPLHNELGRVQEALGTVAQACRLTRPERPPRRPHALVPAQVGDAGHGSLYLLVCGGWVGG